MNPTSSPRSNSTRVFWIFVVALALLLVALFLQAMQPGYVHHNNDRPLGVMEADAEDYPGFFKGSWLDLNWIGVLGTTALPSVFFLLDSVLGSIWLLKISAPFSLLLAGAAA